MSVVEIAGGRYVSERRIGQGGMATVYLARDQRLDRPVALKLLADNLAGDAAFRRRFEREARLAAKLSHPNVVQVFDVGEEDDRPYLVMELVDGRTLAEMLQGKRRLKPDETIELLAQVAAGLGHAHEHGLVHRDVKPANLLLRRDGRLKIADFGIARALEETTGLTRPGSVLGTAPYLAPEQIRGGEVSAATDVYGCGVVAYEMLTGRTPYRGRTIEQLAASQRQGAVEPPRAIARRTPPELDALVMRMLDPSPKRRPRSGAEVEAELEQIEGGAGPPLRRRTGSTAVMRAETSDRSVDAAETAAGTETAGEAETAIVSLSRHALERVRSTARRHPGAVAAATLAALALAFAAIAVPGGEQNALERSPQQRGEEGARSPQNAADAGPVPPIPHRADPAAQASALADWLRERSR